MALVTQQKNISIFQTKFSTAGGFVVTLLGLAILSLIERILYDTGRLLAPPPLDYFNNFAVVGIHAAVVFVFLAIAFFANLFLGERKQKYAMALVPYFVVSILVALQLVLQVSIYFSYHHTTTEFYLVISALTIISTLLMYLAQKRFVSHKETGEGISEPSTGVVIGFVILFMFIFAIVYQFESSIAQNAHYRDIEIEQQEEMMQQQRQQQLPVQQNVVFHPRSGAYDFSTPPQLNNGLVGRWALTGPANNPIGDQSLSLGATVVNNPSWSAVSNTNSNSQIQGLLNFPGTSNTNIEVPALSQLEFPMGSTISLASWINPRALGTYNTILAKDMSESGGHHTNYALRVGGSGSEHRLEFYYAGTNGVWQEYVSNSDVVVTDTWQHVAATYTFGNSSSMKLYVNGALIPGSWVNGDGTQVPTIIHNVLFIAENNDVNYPNYWSGILADIRIYNRALSATEINQLYSSAKLPEGSFN